MFPFLLSRLTLFFQDGSIEALFCQASWTWILCSKNLATKWKTRTVWETVNNPKAWSSNMKPFPPPPHNINPTSPKKHKFDPASPWKNETDTMKRKKKKFHTENPFLWIIKLPQTKRSLTWKDSLEHEALRHTFENNFFPQSRRQ